MSPHTHDHGVSGKRLPICIGLNLLITVAEVVGGILSGSLALLSDAMHNLNDTASLGITYVARRLGARPADPHRTFGYRRAEILGAFTNLVVLVVIALFLIREAVARYFNPREIDAPIMLSVAVIGLAANVATALLLHREARHSLNIRSAFLHIMSDAISSVAVIGGGIAVLVAGAHWVDPLLTLLIAGYIISQSVALLRETGHILLQGTPRNVDLEAVRATINRLEHIQDVHHVHIWSLDEHTVLLDAHILVDEPEIQRLEDMKAQIRSALADEFDIRHSTLEFELPGSPCAGKDSP